ncbi:MAG: response regulator [Rhizobiales bacterium]|nr:response regulator [Hyphomicrobiales bacterium]
MVLTELKKITYVEDEPDIRAVAELALTLVGNFTVDVCVSGMEAIEKAPEFGPDLILLDVMMPGMDGVETFHKLREKPELADTPIIFMTAKVQKHEIESYRELGAIDVIAKPFDPMTLGQEINTIWTAYMARGAT